jgi:hypothetical protein
MRLQAVQGSPRMAAQRDAFARLLPPPIQIPTGAATVQRILLSPGKGGFRRAAREDEDAFETDLVPREKRIGLRKELEAEDGDLAAEVVAGWIDAERDHTSLIEHETDELIGLIKAYAGGKSDPFEVQQGIGTFVAGYVERVVASVLSGIGLDAADFAVLLVGSAARGEMFPGSDIDLLLIGAAVPMNQQKAVQAEIAELSTAIVTGAYRKLEKDLGKDKLPLSLDVCLVNLFHTPESAADKALNSAGSGDNMLADTRLVGEGGGDQKAAFESQYREGLAAARIGGAFLAERLAESRGWIIAAIQQLKDKKGAFNVKTGLLRPPSLVARDYFTWLASEDPKLEDPGTTAGRLKSFTQQDESKRLSEGAVGMLLDGMVLATRLRFQLHAQHNAEVDVLDPKTKKGLKKPIEQALSGYGAALSEALVVAQKNKLAPRKAKKEQKTLGSGGATPWSELTERGFPRKSSVRGKWKY